jgi:hypothetical protein
VSQRRTLSLAGRSGQRWDFGVFSDLLLVIIYPDDYISSGLLVINLLRVSREVQVNSFSKPLCQILEVGACRLGWMLLFEGMYKADMSSSFISWLGKHQNWPTRTGINLKGCWLFPDLYLVISVNNVGSYLSLFDNLAPGGGVFDLAWNKGKSWDDCAMWGYPGSQLLKVSTAD